MYQPLVLFLGIKYSCGRAGDRFGRFVAWFSALGIALGVMALIVVLSVMNGFEREMKSRILDLMPQALITTAQGHVNPHKFNFNQNKFEGISRIAPFSTTDLVLQSAHQVAAGIALGILANEPDPLAPYFVNVTQDALQSGNYQVILGDKLASQLGVTFGEKLRITAPSANQFTPMGRVPSQRLFTVAGIFSANSEVDTYQLLMNQQDLSRLLRYPSDDVTGWRLWLTDPLDVEKISRQILPDGLIWKDWREQKGDLFQAMKMEKNMMGLLLSLIILVAAFNIMTSLGILTMEKKAEVAILQTQGMTQRQMMTVFMIQGAIAGILGTLLGTLLGYIFVHQLKYIAPLFARFLESAFLPTEIIPGQIFFIVICGITLSLLSTLYPAWRAANIAPAEALRNE